MIGHAVDYVAELRRENARLRKIVDRAKNYCTLVLNPCPLPISLEDQQELKTLALTRLNEEIDALQEGTECQT